MKSIQTILVANRGEIACRIMRTCRAMGIRSVAVYSDADADAPFVAMADDGVRIGPPPSAESYLVIDKILAAAKLTGAGAIHPGYGFLAENAGFAEACAAAGVVFIGPSADAIRTLGSKRESKRLAAEAGVPVIPGYSGQDQSVDKLAIEAADIGFPLLLKASAGGGGKGMRVVREAGELSAALESAKREAMSSFGDDTMLIERYIDKPRHIEFQILGDSHGNLIHLFERECSIQRRHQKIIEETPSTALSPELRGAMGEAAVAVGRAVNYENAGTVELILAPSGDFYFLEVNTRLQVEHPVTECITGLDLVREQIRVARGEPLGMTQKDVSTSGAAIECRLYAEDPDNDFLPTSGRVVDWHEPDVDGLRIDTGVTAGQQVSIHYDPMLAKVICHAPTRAEVIQKLIYSLRELAVQGIVTNRDFLTRVLDHAAFRAGDIDTHFLETHKDDMRAPQVSAGTRAHAAIAATLLAYECRRDAREVLPHVSPGFRNNPVQDEWVNYDAGEDAIEVRYRATGGGRFRFEVAGVRYEVGQARRDGAHISYEDGDGRRRRARVVRDGARHLVHAGISLALVEQPRFPDTESAGVEGGCVASMPGKVIKVLVSEGQNVTIGDTLVILEAMKMEHAVKAPSDGVVEQVAVDEGDQVEADQLLVVVATAD